MRFCAHAGGPARGFGTRNVCVGSGLRARVECGTRVRYGMVRTRRRVLWLCTVCNGASDHSGCARGDLTPDRTHRGGVPVLCAAQRDEETNKTFLVREEAHARSTRCSSTSMLLPLILAVIMVQWGCRRRSVGEPGFNSRMPRGDTVSQGICECPKISTSVEGKAWSARSSRRLACPVS